MSVNEAFREFQTTVNVDMTAVREARARRDLFADAFTAEDDVVEVVPSGSLARGTHKDPLHDVDVIIVFDGAAHPDWGQPGPWALDALDHTRSRVNALLGSTNGSHDKAVRLARRRNHAVKCFLDDPDDPDAFTVDAMPALRRDNKMLIPELASEDWVYSNPEFLIREVAARHAKWNKFAGTVRMLKWWAAEQDIKIKSLVMEVLALQFLPLDSAQPSATKDFFVKSAYYIAGGGVVEDPADLCGPIQSDLDYQQFADRLTAASKDAAQAIQSQINNGEGDAVAHWRRVFGDAFPASSAAGIVAAPLTPRPVKDTPQG